MSWPNNRKRILKLEDISDPSIGPGLSHPEKGTKTQLYKMLVRETEFSLMKVELRAESEAHAMKYARARWPDAAIELRRS